MHLSTCITLHYNAGISVNTTPFCHLFESLKGNYTQFFAKTEEAAPWFVFRIPHICDTGVVLQFCIKKTAK